MREQPSEPASAFRPVVTSSVAQTVTSPFTLKH
jgi:hypothetical protein